MECLLILAQAYRRVKVKMAFVGQFTCAARDNDI